MKKHKKIALLICCILALTQYGNATDCNSAKDLPADKQVKIGKLKNGLTYYIRKNDKPEGRAHFRLVVKAGAIQEDDDQDGLAHFCEHMAFNGTKNFPKNKLVDFLQKSGVQFGADLNASTGMERTMYELPIPIDDVEFVNNAFQILEDWAHNASYDNDMIDGERGVILAEWRQRNSSTMRMYNKFRNYLFKDSKYAKRNVIGDTSIIKNFPHETIKRFYKDWYRPELMAFIAVGDFDVKKIESLIKKHFERLANPAYPRKYEYFPIPYHKETLVAVGSDKELTGEQIGIYFKFDEYDPKTAAGYLEDIKRQLYDIMFGARINEILQKPNPPFVSAGGSETAYYGKYRAYILSAQTKPGGLKEGLDAIMTEAVRAKQHGFTSSEFDRAKSIYLSRLEKAHNERKTRLHSSYVDEYTNNFTSDEPIPGIEYELEFVKSCLPGISLGEINSLAKYYIKSENTVLTASIPENAGGKIIGDKELLGVFNQSLAKKTEPYKDIDAGKPLFSKSLKEGSIINEKELKEISGVELTLSNGAKVILKKTDFKNDEILFDAFSPGGTSLIENNDYISSILAPELITNIGISEFDLTQLQKLLAGKIVRLSPYITDLYECMTGSSSKKDLETLFQLIHLYFADPRYDENAFKTYYSRLSAFLANSGNSTDRVFADSVNSTLYNRHYRKRPLNLNTLKELNYDKAYAIYKDRYANAGDFTFIFVGDFELDDLRKFAKKYIAALPSNNRLEKWEDRNVTPTAKLTENIYRKGNEDRANVRLSFTSDVNWSEANRYLFESIADYIDIKVLEIVREEKSGVYSPRIYAEISKYPKPKFMLHINFVSEPSRVNELVNTVIDIVKDMLVNCDDIVIDKIKRTHQRKREVALKNNNYWLNNLSLYGKNNEDPKLIVDFDNLVKNLNAKDFQNFVKVAIKPERYVKVVNLPEK